MADDRANEKIQAFYDGKCPMCVALMGAVERSSHRAAFDLHDMHAERRLPFARDAVQKEIHIVDAEGRTHKGAMGILKILEQYPRFRTVARIGRSPVLGPILPLGYWVVAANRRFLFGAASRILWLKVAIVLAFCAGLALSAPLWIGPRSYPLAPVSSSLPSTGTMLDAWLFAGLFALAAAILVSPRPQKFIAAFLAVIAVFCILDQTRLQPWVYQYGFLLATLALFSWNSDDVEARTRALNVARLIVASTYVFSGLQKFNPTFMQVEFPWIVEPITSRFPAAEPVMQRLAMAAPFLQIGFGIGLLTRRFRLPSLAAAVTMHVFILAMFGPLGHNWNTVIWPWTAAMALFDILLFGRKEHFAASDIVWTKPYAFHALAVLTFVVLPLLSFVNAWDSYLSSALYSGNVTEAELYVSDSGRQSLPPVIQRHLITTSPNTHVINLQRWAIEDIHVTPYPETRIYKQVARDLCGRLLDPAQLVLIVREQRLLFSKPERGYRCWEL